MIPRPRADHVAQYAASHTNRVNKALHLLGIPMIALSVLLLFLSLEWGHLFVVSLALLATGWLLQLIGHAFEGRGPVWFSGWRFMLVGLHWWRSSMRELLARQI